MKTVAIIGGGFCGTMAAVNLARLATQPLHIVLINQGSPLGRGVAYGTRQAEHLLNVPARNMSALADQPNHFREWLGTRSEYTGVPESVLRETFAPRRIYGDYLQGLLFWYTKSAAERVRFDTVHGEALDLVPQAERVAVVVAQHPTILADKVLLATGNPAPADLAAGLEHPRFLANPWNWTDFISADRRDAVVLLGTSLTMIDAFLTLSALDWQGPIVAVSRNGLLPLAHFHGIAYDDFPPADPTALGLSGLVQLMEEHCQRLRAMGENPAIVVDKLRPFSQRIWQSFSLEEKRRFCREYRTPWNVTRHRIPKAIHDRLTEAIAAGKLQILAGKIAAVTGDGAHVRVDIDRPKGESTTLEADWVVNCTGPRESYRQSSSVLYQNLLDRGLVQADELDMGIRAAANFAVVDGGGQTSPFLFAIGPMLKGSLWETTAVPELRFQALRSAETMLSALQGEAAPGWFAEMWVDLLEYDVLDYHI